jgi:hypothetical protein
MEAALPTYEKSVFLRIRTAEESEVCVELAVFHYEQCAEVIGLRTGLKYDVSLSSQQFVVTHTFRQTDTHALPDSTVTNTPSVKISCPQRTACPYVSVKM